MIEGQQKDKSDKPLRSFCKPCSSLISNFNLFPRASNNWKIYSKKGSCIQVFFGNCSQVLSTLFSERLFVPFFYMCRKQIISNVIISKLVCNIHFVFRSNVSKGIVNIKNSKYLNFPRDLTFMIFNLSMIFNSRRVVLKIFQFCFQVFAR